jgi:hypothetical protein
VCFTTRFRTCGAWLVRETSPSMWGGVCQARETSLSMPPAEWAPGFGFAKSTNRRAILLHRTVGSRGAGVRLDDTDTHSAF